MAEEAAPGFLSGLMDGFVSTVAPNYFSYMVKQRDAMAHQQSRQAALKQLSDQASSLYDPLLNDPKTSPAKKHVLRQLKAMAISGNVLLADKYPDMVENTQKALLEADKPSSLRSDMEYAAELDPNTYTPQKIAEGIYQTHTKPNTQIMMNAGKPAPSAGYMYSSKEPDDYTQTYIPGGPSDPNKKSLTGEEGKATAFYTTSRAANEALDNLYPKSNIGNLRAQQLAGKVPIVGKATQLMTNKYLSTEEQIVKQSEAQFLDAVNRFRSGASLTEYDTDSANETFFEQPDDSPETRKHKAEMRKITIESMKAAAGLTRRTDDTAIPTTNSKDDRKFITGTDKVTGEVFRKYEDGTIERVGRGL
jgi:hypothetical protein